MRNPLFLTKSDRRALIVLALIALLCVAGMVLWGNKAEGAGDENAEEVEKTEAQEPVTAALSDDMVERTEKITMKIFDPNTVDSVSLVGMGLTPKKVHTFIRYRTAGAVFRKAEDIARCYSFSDDDIDRLLPYVRISQKYGDSGYKRRNILWKITKMNTSKGEIMERNSLSHIPPNSPHLLQWMSTRLTLPC